MHLRELASHRMDKRDECRRSIRDLRVMLDELVADVLGDGRFRFAEVERRVQEPAGGCLKFFLSHESFLLFFSAASHHHAEFKGFTDAQRSGLLDEAADR
jgi:hypothetical protein